MMDNSSLNAGLGVISNCLLILSGLVFLPLLLAFWELYVIFFVLLAGPMLIVRAIVPSCTEMLNKIFNRMWETVILASSRYLRFFFCQS